MDLLGWTFLSELLDDQVVYFFVELHDVVPLELIIYMSKGDLRVLGADLNLDGIFFGKKLKLFQCTLKMLDLSKD